MQPIPVSRHLVPANPAEPPADAQLVDLALLTGLPAVIPLVPDVTLTLTLATGLATEWRAADPLAVVSASAAESEPWPPGDGAFPEVDAARPTLWLQRGGRTITVLPLVVGRHALVEAGGDGVSARRYDLWLLGWDIRAGTVRGPGDFGSRLRLAWRAADRGAPRYAALPAVPAVALRTPPPPDPPRPPDGGGIRILGAADRIRLKRGRLSR